MLFPLQALAARETTEGSRAEKQLVTLLSIPLDTYEVLTVLSLGNYPKLMSLLQVRLFFNFGNGAPQFMLCCQHHATPATPFCSRRSGLARLLVLGRLLTGRAFIQACTPCGLQWWGH